MKPSPVIKFPAVGICIYCGRMPPEFPLTDEHIIPYSLGGNFLLPKSSCSICQRETHAYEGHCAGTMFKSLRAHHQFPTRRKKNRPKSLAVVERAEGEETEFRMVPTAEAPGVVVLPTFGPAGILMGATSSNAVSPTGMAIYSTTSDAIEREKKLTSKGASAGAYTQFSPFAFGRMLAKIAHSSAVAAFGLNRFEPLLSPVILGQKDSVFHFVGGSEKSFLPFPSSTSTLHQIGTKTFLIGLFEYLVVEVRLFSLFNPLPPSYQIVVGKFLPATKLG